MWAKLVHCHFLNVPAVLNEVTTGNGTGTKNVLKLEMCSVSTNGERASPAQQGFQLIGCHISYTLDKHANIQVNSLPEYQELVHTSVHKCIRI